MDLINHPTLLHWSFWAYPIRRGIVNSIHLYGSTNSDLEKVRRHIQKLKEEYPTTSYHTQYRIAGYRGAIIEEEPRPRVKPGAARQLEAQN